MKRVVRRNVELVRPSYEELSVNLWSKYQFILLVGSMVMMGMSGHPALAGALRSLYPEFHLLHLLLFFVKFWLFL